jgi:flagellar protein FlgJ
MISGADLSGNVAFDANGLNGLKNAAKENSPEAIKGVAKQFEAIFMNMMLKSMREASPQDNPFDNEQSRTFTSMLDQQLSSNLASKGLGLADVLTKQLSKGNNPVTDTMEQAVTDVQPTSAYGAQPNPIISNPLSQAANSKVVANPQDFKAPLEYKNTPTETSLINNKVDTKSLTDSATEFKNRMAKHAAEASRTTGIPAHLMLGQAALESGWGKRELKGADGTPSNNLFGIKATGGWDGKVVEATTTEYIHGVKQKRIEKFRAYDSYADSFKDFANMMSNNPRYDKVMANLDSVNGYAQAMQNAGYATDPHYASKLASVIQKVTP